MEAFIENSVSKTDEPEIEEKRKKSVNFQRGNQKLQELEKTVDMEIGKKFSNTSRDINEDGPLDYSDDAFELNDEVINYSDGNAEEQDPSSSGGFKKRSKKELVNKSKRS